MVHLDAEPRKSLSLLQVTVGNDDGGRVTVCVPLTTIKLTTYTAIISYSGIA
jgi:hypothetical protein